LSEGAKRGSNDPLTAAVLSDINRIAVAQGRDDDHNNMFWHNLGKIHRDKIERYGFETFKRHINLAMAPGGSQSSVAASHFSVSVR
jgi:hypothetical protein